MISKGDVVKYKGYEYIVEENLGEGLLLVNSKNFGTKDPFKTLLPGVQLLNTLVVAENFVEVIKNDTSDATVRIQSSCS